LGNPCVNRRKIKDFKGTPHDEQKGGDAQTPKRGGIWKERQLVDRRREDATLRAFTPKNKKGKKPKKNGEPQKEMSKELPHRGRVSRARCRKIAHRGRCVKRKIPPHTP